jgi:replicative DNA helicase
MTKPASTIKRKAPPAGRGSPEVRRNGQAPSQAAQERPIFDRAPPFDPEAEIGVLGSCMLMPEALDEVLLIVTADDFHDPAHNTLFGVMAEMHAGKRGCDPTLLLDELAKKGKKEEIGGVAYLAKVLHAVPTAAHARYYADIVHEKATQRRLIAAATEVLREAYEDCENVPELVSRAEAAFAEVAERGIGGGELITASTLMSSALDELDDRIRGTVHRGVPTGFYKLDEQLRGGLRNGSLTIIAGRPSMGKTALALNIAAHVSRAGHPVYFQSLEMSVLEMGERLLCTEARIDSHRLANGLLGQADRLQMIEAAGEISKTPLYVDDTPTRTVSAIAAQARRMSRKHGLKLLVIDYLQLIEPDNPKDSREQQVTRMTRRLKILARELDIPVVVLAQLNRKAEESRDNRPRLSHLRESGAIEQDADVVLFPFRAEYYEPENRDLAGKAELIVAKQRNGPTGDVALAWLAYCTRFENLAEQRFEEFEAFEAQGRSMF